MIDAVALEDQIIIVMPLADYSAYDAGHRGPLAADAVIPPASTDTAPALPVAEHHISRRVIAGDPCLTIAPTAHARRPSASSTERSADEF
jgi:hypothetical protein